MKWTEWLGQWTIVKKVFVKDFYELIENVTNMEISRDYFENSSIKLAKELAELLKHVHPVVQPNPFIKHKNERIYYNAPNRKLVTSYIKYELHPTIKAIAQDIRTTYNLTANDKDGVIKAISNWWIPRFGLQNSKKDFIYVSEQREKWQTAIETSKIKHGDCDDYMIMLYSIARQVFKDLDCWDEVKERLICNAGNVNVYNQFSSPVGGHAYLSWIAEDKEEYTFETTYNPKIALAYFLIKPQKINTAYGNIWFSFNEEKMIRRHNTF